MGYISGTRIWVGFCPTAAWIDRETCCISLNIAPTVYSFVCMCIILGCVSYGWVLTYLATAPIIFGYIL